MSPETVQPEVDPRTMRALTESMTVLPEHGWTLTKIDLDARREEVTVDA